MGSSYLTDCITDWRKKIGRKRENKKKTICVKNEDLIMFFTTRSQFERLNA
jgi:hypothetical protein